MDSNVTNPVPEEAKEHQQYIRQQLKQAGKWQNAGIKTYSVLLILFMGSLVVLLTYSSHTSPPQKTYSRTTGKIIEVGACTVMASLFVGTFIGYVVSRRRLQSLVTELNQGGASFHYLVSSMTHEKDKEIKSAAETYLRLLTKNGIALSTSETLVRASQPPLTAAPDTLLRAATDNYTAPPEQLLRATTGQAEE